MSENGGAVKVAGVAVAALLFFSFIYVVSSTPFPHASYRSRELLPTEPSDALGSRDEQLPLELQGTRPDDADTHTIRHGDQLPGAPQGGETLMANDVIFLGAIFAMVSIGLYCVTQKSMIRILLGVEIILNAGNFALVYFASYRVAEGFVDPLGQSLAFMSIILGGSVIAVGLALIVNAYKQFKTTEVDKMRRLKW